MSAKIAVDRERIAVFCRRHHIRKLSLFGSVLRDDFTPESDVDVLLFRPHRRRRSALRRGPGQIASYALRRRRRFRTRDSVVFAGHMLDAAREALELSTGKTR